MATQSQIQANRRNALNSTGPRTPEGKARSSANSLKHGLSARFRVLTSESQDDFDDLLAELTRTFAPTNVYEHILVMEIAQSHWRLARVRRIEADMIDDMAACHSSSDHEGTLRSLLLNDKAGPFLVLQRHAAAAERSGYRAVKQLQTGRKLEAQAARDAARQNEANPATSPSDSGGSALPDDAAPAGTRRDGQATGKVREFQRASGTKIENRAAPE
jgi:hypothetical protein